MASTGQVGWVGRVSILILHDPSVEGGLILDSTSGLAPLEPRLEQVMFSKRSLIS